jgi:hypothetical protein
MAASVDKDFLVIEGASHGRNALHGLRAISGAVSEYGENLFDQVANWINARF